VCGTGLGDLVNAIESPETFPYEKIPKFPVSTGWYYFMQLFVTFPLTSPAQSMTCVSPTVSVQGHAGNLVFGILNGKQVVCMQGRFHYYEGYSLNKVNGSMCKICCWWW
jgi:purine-nucleoside phosphorylase